MSADSQKANYKTNLTVAIQSIVLNILSARFTRVSVSLYELFLYEAFFSYCRHATAQTKFSFNYYIPELNFGRISTYSKVTTSKFLDFDFLDFDLIIAIYFPLSL